MSNVAHIPEIVSMQQNHARITGFTGAIPLHSIVGDALRMAAGGIRRRGVEVIRKHERAGTLVSPELLLAHTEDAS